MAKRKQPDTSVVAPDTPSKRPRKSIQDPADVVQSTSTSDAEQTPRKKISTPSKLRTSEQIPQQNGIYIVPGSATPKPDGKTLFTTPRKNKTSEQTPSKTKRADQSAKKKSAQALAEIQNEDDWDGQNALAREILGEDAIEETNGVEPSIEEDDKVASEATTPVATPSKRGRPKGSKNKRSPTPEGDLPPEERYFFQNRAGPPQVSSNTLASVKLLSHDEYFEQIRKCKDSHESERARLMKLHARSFPQWKFEFSQGFNICLYGYGSKRKLLNNFAEWLHKSFHTKPKIVVINGYATKLNVRTILHTIGSALVGEEEELKMSGQPQEMLDTLLSYLSANPPTGQLVVMINSIDAASIKRPSIQSLLARLASHSLVNLIASADTPTFSLLWNSTLLDQFNFAFHDCTTFAPYEVEISVVDEVNELLGRKGRRLGGKEGIGFVLKSLPENARNLYRILLNEIISVLTDGIDGVMDEAVDLEDGQITKPIKDATDDVGVEYRALYQKASEEFICSSDLNFRFLLKEFHDHQMITSRRDASGTELLGVPLGKEEIEGVLEDLG